MDTPLSCYSATEVAKATGLSLSMVRKLTRTGAIPHIRVGRRILYPILALNEWMFSIITSQAATETDDDLDG